MTILSLPIELGAVIVGALSGATHAVARKADAIGVFTIALASSVGGGILRDVLISQGPPVALRAPLYLPIVAAASLVAFLFASWLVRIGSILAILDALLLGLWTVLGAERAAAHGLPWTAVIFLGTVTATAGSVLRDLLCGEPPAASRKGELYVTASFLAASAYVVAIEGAGAPRRVAEVVTLCVASAIRLAAMRWKVTAPEPFDLPTWWRRRRGQPDPRAG
jgi:uncharacterized membrane protein YeiH